MLTCYTNGLISSKRNPSESQQLPLQSTVEKIMVRSIIYLITLLYVLKKKIEESSDSKQILSQYLI